jgi:hypothetical protein
LRFECQPDKPKAQDLSGYQGMKLSVFDAQHGEWDAAAATAALREAGAFLVRGILNPEEIQLARRQVNENVDAAGKPISLGRTLPNAAILSPDINWLVAHPGIVGVFKEVLGEQVVFTGHCDIHKNLLSGWHKDSGEHIGGYFSGDYFSAPDCRVYKAAVYLQDATVDDGLTVRLGSHRTALHRGVECWIPSKAGDVVFFDVRLSHTGQLPDVIENVIKAASRMRSKADRHDPRWATNLRSAYSRLRGRRDRLSVFFTYGYPNDYTHEFARVNMDRQLVQSNDSFRVLPGDLVSSLGRQGVSLANFGSAG